jgi:hypothetical protein
VSCHPPSTEPQNSVKHLAVVVLLLVVLELVKVPFLVVVVLDVAVMVEVVVYGHSAHPLQYQFWHATFQPPCMVPHSNCQHCDEVVVDTVAFGSAVVVFVIVDVVV